ncbi:DUF6431 domain-containing protein [Anaerobacillus isosaccharinicus]|uniref:DUF6431 domain-containing protein n=1 Tax=Anaerobacillus isosaccharinicus TaxID=1532552 RepID=A0A1S2MDS5_9BACI|nr:DUF6431 domain-containing protein [Anaerobacillus isosaccharinicus]MBA5584267.1 hypothetical protein [Anaerobacillus isosaccharinicus]QOY37332.1 hypothetical protein AWH56_006805 [Anaerobacillus isosaccharinicus]
MIIIRYLGKSIKSYLSNYQEVPPCFEGNCPDCDHKLYRHGKYFRSAITKKKITWIPIYRFLCPACGKTFSLLPDFLLPYQIHASAILQRAWTLRFIKKISYAQIQSIISYDETGGISVKTIKRWERFWKQKENDLIDLLNRGLVELSSDSTILYMTKKLSDQQTFLYLLRKLWKILHPDRPYPICGFFPWINQLINKI